MHLFPLDSFLPSLDCAHESPRLRSEASFSVVFLFAELLASVPTFLELTCEFLSLTLTEIQPVVTFHFLVNRLRKHFITQMPRRGGQGALEVEISGLLPGSTTSMT